MQTFQPVQDQEIQSLLPNSFDGAISPSQQLPVYYGGLESILESERSSQDNIRASQERRPEFQFQAPSLQVSQRDRSESERSAGAYDALLRKVSILESELVKERAKTQVLSKDNYTKRQETEEKKMLHEDLSVVSARMEDLEDKLTQISTENQRLQILINTQKLTISELQSQNKSSSGQAAVTATTTTTIAVKANSAQSQPEENIRIREQVNEQMRVFWKEHFERVQATMIERYESEKKQLIQQLNVKEQLNQQLQASFDTHTNYVVEKSQMVSQIESQAQFIQDLEYQLEIERQTSGHRQQELKDREVEITQVQICLNELEMKLMELKSVNDRQSEQLSRLNQIELEAGNVLQENTRLSNEIQELKEQREQSIKEIEKETQQQEIHQRDQNTQWQALLSVEKENSTRVYEQWKYSESELIKELEEFKVLMKEMKGQIYSIEQQITILEDDKEKLLVILATKADVEHDCEVLNEKNAQLELEVTQLLQSNSFLNGNLNSRLKEVGMWKDRHAQSVEECRRVSQEYQEHISKQIEEHARELQDEKMKKSMQITKMSEELNSVQSKLQQFQFESTSQHALEIEKLRYLVSQLHEKLSNSQGEVVSLQQCLIELEHHHSRKTSELSEQFSGKINRLLEEHKKKIDDIQASRAMLRVQLQQMELQNSQLHSTLLVQQEAHQGVISRMMEERVGNSRGFGSVESVELIEKGQLLNTAGELHHEILKNNPQADCKNGPYSSAPENLQSGSSSSPYFPQLFQKSSDSGQYSSSSSGPLFPRKTPLGNFRSSLKDQGSQGQNQPDEDPIKSPQESSLQREINYLETHERTQQELMKVLAAENTELKSGLRDLERQIYANNDGRVYPQEKKDDRSRQSSGKRSGDLGVKEALKKEEQEENHGDDQAEVIEVREQYPQETLGREDFERREGTENLRDQNFTSEFLGKKQDQERRTNKEDLADVDLSSHSHGEDDLEDQLGLEEDQEDPNSNGDRYEHGEEYDGEEGEDHGDGEDHEEQFEDDEEWDKDF